MEAIIDAVQRLSSAVVEQWHAEGGGGQYELATTHADAFKVNSKYLYVFYV